jgi:hypothetical protein
MELPTVEGKTFWLNLHKRCEGPIPFPFHAYYVNQDECFEALKGVRPITTPTLLKNKLNPLVPIRLDLDTLKGSFLLTGDIPPTTGSSGTVYDEPWKIDRLTLSFSEYSINHAFIKGRPSVAQVWAKNSRSVCRASSSAEAANEALYTMMRKQVNTYSLTRAVSLYWIAIRELKEDLRIFDISAGWGDRMIAAAAVGATYLGIDPNTRNERAYQEISRLGKPGQLEYLLTCAEDVTPELVGNRKFNLIFSCPPYFDKEIYADKGADAQKQSISKLSNVDAWFQDFLLVALTNAWNLLDAGGMMMVTISNYPGEKDFVGRLSLEFHPEAYRGALCYNPKAVFPVLIWKRPLD